MKRTKWFRLSIIALSLILVGCITDYTPEARVLELAPGAPQIFTATSDDPNAKLVWYLDGEQVADDATRYLFVAGQAAGEEALEYHLVVREEGGRYPAFAQSVTWDIKIVAPAVCYLDADGDGFGDPDKMVMEDNPPANCVEFNADCDDGNAAVNPYAEEMCYNGIDDDCNGGVDDGCWDPLPHHVKATDLDADLAAGNGRFNVTVTWNACPGATYYVVYRSIFHEEGEHANYERVSVDPITTTSFTYVQTYEADLLAHVGPMPTLPLNPTDAQKVQFINALTQYRTEKVEPWIYKFKAPSYFKVQACDKNNECSELSQADFGQADFIHRADYSELVPMVIMAWGENLLKILADVPGGPNGANWCGMDICGYDGNGPGGIAMGRLKSDPIAMNMVDWECMYNEFINGADMTPHPDASVAINGLIEGRMDLTEALFHGIYRVGGDFIARLYNRFEVTGTTRIHIGGELNANGQLIPGGRNEGWVAVTYNGVASRYTMPLNPAAVQDPNLNYLQAELPVPTAEINEYGWHSAFSEWTPYYEESGSPFYLCTPENTCESPLIPQPLAPFITGRPPEVQNTCRHSNAAVVGYSQPCYAP